MSQYKAFPYSAWSSVPGQETEPQVVWVMCDRETAALSEKSSGTTDRGGVLKRSKRTTICMGNLKWYS